MFVVLGFPTLFDLFQSLQSPKEPYAISFLPSCDCEDSMKSFIESDELMLGQSSNL